VNGFFPDWIEALHHPGKGQRRTAAVALGAHGPDAAWAVPALTDLRRHPSDRPGPPGSGWLS
jgi:hypothetical protein